jgi:hypothetical protein
LDFYLLTRQHPETIYKAGTGKRKGTKAQTKQKDKKKSKGILVAGRGGLQDCEISKLPHFLNNRLTDGSNVVIRTRRPHFIPVLISVRG